MKQTDGYCLKAPSGELRWNYFEDTMQNVIDAATSFIGKHDKKSWPALQDEGYKVVRVIVQEFSEDES